MSNVNSTTTNDPDFVKFVENIKLWHQQRVANLQSILDAKNAEIVLKSNGGDSAAIEPGTDLHKGIHTGIEIALKQMGRLPFTFQPIANDEDDEDFDQDE